MIHHIALFARRPLETAAFYSALLGLEEIRRSEDKAGLYSIWLKAGRSVLMVERADEAPGEELPEGLRPANHCLIAFCLDAKEEVAFIERLTSLGGRILHRTDFTLYFRDPEGNRAAVSWYPL